MPHHALVITLTRAASPAELLAACRRMPLAPNHDATGLMVLVKADTPDRAARRLRRRLEDRLPIDVITTHYPDASGQVLLNVAFPPSAHAALTRAAHHAGQEPECFVGLAVRRALAEHAGQEADRLDREVRRLLAGTTPAHLLSAVGHALARIPEGPTP
ncbi:hypothetical protein ABZ864_43160 [Streptomyces sp. NPDC047082]|uniref:hypothetical protein n=1 Tax=Streptomyces sp. NPDC047082 TaxID=3155259 RepID=UPI0034086011